MDSIITWLGQFAYDCGIGVMMNNLDFDQSIPSVAKGKNIIVNLNWRNKKEIPFIFAHEIGHVLNGDKDAHYFNGLVVDSTVEMKANDNAIDLFLDYADGLDGIPDNYLSFMESYGIPLGLEDEVKKRYAIHFND